MNCPCGHPTSYRNCCQPFHKGEIAATPEQLMRARYAAHVLQLVDYIIQTYHSSCHAEMQRKAIADSAANQWVKLEIIDAPIPISNEGFVEFKAYFYENEQLYCLQERSRFIKEKGQWKYIDGVFN